MDQILPWIVASSLLLNFILVITVGFVIYKLLIKKKDTDPVQNFQPQQTTLQETELQKLEKRTYNMSHKVMLNENVQAMKQMYEELQNKKGDYCIDHPSEVSIGVCAISGFRYCEHCLKIFQNIKFGKKYLNIYLASEWEDFMTISKNNGFEDVSPVLLDLKKQMWEADKIPVIVQNHFKINVSDDSIEAFTVLKGRKHEISFLTEKFSKII